MLRPKFRFAIPFLAVAALVAVTYGLTVSSSADCAPSKTKSVKAAKAKAKAKATKTNNDAPKAEEGKEKKKVSKATVVPTADFEQEVLKSKQPVLVDFFADWCGPCRMLAPTIDELAVEYDGKAKVVKVNTDQSQQIAAKYGIRGIPTIIIFKNGEPIDRTTGVQPKSELAKKLDSAIKN